MKKDGNITIQFETESSKFKLEDSDIYEGASYKPFITYENNLYEFKGNPENDEVGLYKITYKLGLRDENNRYIYEYSKSERRSFIEENNVKNIIEKQESNVEVIEDDIPIFEGGIYDSGPEDKRKTELDCD